MIPQECEADHLAIALPEISALSSWPRICEALLRVGLCAEMASCGLPRILLELRSTPPVRLWAERDMQATETEVVYVTRLVKGRPCAEAVALPLDPELFQLLSSEAVAHAAHAQLSTTNSFQFQAPERLDSGCESFSFDVVLRLVKELGVVQKRLQRELSTLLAELLDGHGSIARLLHLASDLHQAELLLDLPRPAKRLCQAWPGRQGPEEAAEVLRALAHKEGLATVRVELGEEEVDGPWLSTELPEPKGVRGGCCYRVEGHVIVAACSCYMLGSKMELISGGSRAAGQRPKGLLVQGWQCWTKQLQTLDEPSY